MLIRKNKGEVPIDNLIWACGEMVDTLVLGTSAKAWEFESLHAQTKKGLGPKSNPFLFEIQTLRLYFCFVETKILESASDILNHLFS